MKSYFKNMKTITKADYATYLGVILAFIVVSICQSPGAGEPLPGRHAGAHLLLCVHVCLPEPDGGCPGGAVPGPRGFHERGRLLRHHHRHEPRSARLFWCGWSSPWWRAPSSPRHRGLHRGHPGAAAAGRLSGHRQPWPSARSSRTSSTACWWAGTRTACTSP